MAWQKWTRSAATAALLLAVAAPAVDAQSRPLEFRLTFDRSACREPFTGRVFVLLTKKDPGSSLPTSPNWFRPEPFFALDVKGWKPGETITLGQNSQGYPTPLAGLARGKYHVRAVMDFGLGISFAAAEGNVYSAASVCDLDPAASGPVAMTLDRVYHGKPFPETDRVKLVEIPSKLLSDYHGRTVRLRAGVVLPPSFASEPRRRYPVVYEVPGFGGDHFGALRAAKRNSTDLPGVESLYVVLDPSCPLGHQVFADSANNGPYGRALVEELIPHIEKTYRGPLSAARRLVTGHSSGGWSSLWLQVTYPDTFGGVWSTAPDPVDFRDFQRINLYLPGVNMFKDDQGKDRPIARMSGKPVLFYKPFSDMEEVMGHGGQLGSFEAVFSPRGPDGRPRKLWDRRTGAVDAETARAWERYDIRLILERNWKTLGPKLSGKLHVYMGGSDTFYLEGATRLLRDSLNKLGSDAVVEIVPGKDHGSLMDAKMRERVAREMASSLLRVGPEGR